MNTRMDKIERVVRKYVDARDIFAKNSDPCAKTSMAKAVGRFKGMMMPETVRETYMKKMECPAKNTQPENKYDDFFSWWK